MGFGINGRNIEDAEEEILKFYGLESEDEYFDDLVTKEILDSRIDEFIQHLRSKNTSTNQLQAYSYVLCAEGANLPDDFIDAAINAFNLDIVDEYSAEQRFYMRKCIESLQAYKTMGDKDPTDLFKSYSFLHFFASYNKEMREKFSIEEIRELLVEVIGTPDVTMLRTNHDLTAVTNYKYSKDIWTPSIFDIQINYSLV